MHVCCYYDDQKSTCAYTWNRGTIKSEAYRHHIKRINPNVEVTGVACPGFVPLVEQMRYNDPTITSIIIHQTLKHWRNSIADTVILGCTHYPLLYQPLNDYFGGDKTVISSGLETAREVSALLTFSNEHASYTAQQHRFFLQVIRRILLILLLSGCI